MKKQLKLLNAKFGKIMLASSLIIGGYSILYPVKASAATLIVNKVAQGRGHTAILKSDGTVWTWGDNGRGQHGNGTTSVGGITPVQATGLSNVVSISAGDGDTMALKQDGTVWMWGDANTGWPTSSKTPIQIGGLSNIVAISSGGNPFYALRSDGTVWGWGSDYYGELGIGSKDTTTPFHATPVQILSNVVSIAAGNGFALAVKTDGTVWAWGKNDYGQIGNGTGGANAVVMSPVQVSGLTNVKSVGAGQWHSTALKNDGTVWAWGGNSAGQLGNGTTNNGYSPAQVSGLSGVSSMADGVFATFVIKSDGTAWSFGNTGYGTLGRTSSTIVGQITPLANVTGIAGGSYGGVSMLSDGTVWTWGINDYNQLGNSSISTSSNAYTPVRAGGGGFYITPDTTPPIVSLTASTISPTNKPVTITVDATDSVGVTQTKWAAGNQSAGYFGTAGTDITSTKSFTVATNGTYTAWATDAAGNQTVQTITVSNIDTMPPADATFSADKTIPTNQNVTVTINYPANGTVKEYRVNGGAWTAYSAPVVMTTNGTVDARSTSLAGNVSNVTTYTVNNIDKIPPTAPTFVADKTAPTNTDVTVTVTYPGDAAVKEVRVNGGSWTAYSAPVVMTANGTVDARSTDAAGNLSNVTTYMVSNIDKVSPTAPTFVADKTAPTNTDIMVTVNYPGDAAVKEFRVNGGSWTSYSAPVAMTANGLVEARATDAAGNVSALGTLNVTNIDKVAPTAPTSQVVGNKLTVTPGTDASGIQNTLVQLNGGAWTSYTGVVTLPDGNYTINVKSVDTVGNESSVTTINAQVTVQALANATASVSQAETTKSQADVDSAWTFVNALPASPEKDALNVRLDAVQAQIDANNAMQAQIEKATNAVSQAEATKLQADVDSAWTFVNALPASPEKDALNVRLDQVKADIQLSNQVSAIKNELDTMKSDVTDGNDSIEKLNGYQARLGQIIDLVDALPNTVNKDPLYTEIGEIYDMIDLIKSVFSLESVGGGTVVNLDDLQDNINQLPNGDLKENLQNQLNNKLLQDATNSVEVAEASKSQSDVEKARQDVAKLPDGQIKDDLNKRLDDVQKQINDEKTLADAITTAKNEVAQAEQSKSQTDVDKARADLANLPEGQDKTDLNKRLDAVQKQIDDAKALSDAIAISTSEVAQAETSKSQVDVDKARTDVSKLPDGQAKTDLNNRLDSVQKQIDAEKATKALQAAKNAVALVESTHKIDDYNYALALVNALPNSADKNALQARIDEVKRLIDAETLANQLLTNATKQVETAEKFHTVYNVDRAQQAIDLLPNGADKTALQARIDAIKAAISQEAYNKQLADATAKVIQAEQYKRDPYLADAQKLVDALRNGADKSALQTRIDAIRTKLALEAYKKQLAEATAAVAKAEIDKLQPSIDSARTLVNALPNNVDRASLQARLDAIHVDPLSAADQVTSDIDKVTNITVKVKLSDLDKYVRVAESYPSKANITNAINKLNALSADVKTQYKTIVDNLAERCEILRVAYNRQLAIDSVVSFEKYRLPNYKLQAQGAVDALPSGSEKDALQARINAVVMK